MKSRIFSTGISAFALFSLFFPFFPQYVFAASVQAPDDLEIVGGVYTNDTTPTFTWDAPSGATWYEYAVDTSGLESIGNVLSYTVSSLDDGWHTFYLRAHDNSGNMSDVTWILFEIDTEGPTVPKVSPSSAYEDEKVTFTVEPYGEAAPLWCDLYVDGDNVGDMEKDGADFSFDHTFSWDGTYTVYAHCTDADGNATIGASRTVTVYDEHDDDDDAFTVPKVSPSFAYEDEEVTFTVEPYGDLYAESCTLYVDGDYVGTMSEDDGEFSRDYTFSRDGEYEVYASCRDEDGDWHDGAVRDVEVDDERDDAEEGSLIKLSCGTSSLASDPCRAVYYYGEDGKRHAFPNESTFYTWYSDFDDVIEVSSSFMSSITIGENVTYRPGSVLVKFESASAVYAVEKERTLRQYETWSLLEGDYGDDGAELIMVLPDSLYASYDVGREIDSSGDFDRTDAYYSVDGIEDIF